MVSSGRCPVEDSIHCRMILRMPLAGSISCSSKHHRTYGQLCCDTEKQKTQGLIEWGRAFKAESWEEVKGIDNPEVKEGEALMTA